MKSKIPVSQIIFCVILVFLLLVRRFSDEDLSIGVYVVNYASMVIALSANWVVVIENSIENRQQNVCKAIFVILLIALIIIGCIKVQFGCMSNRNSDIMTLLALIFCICNTIFEKIICKIFSITILQKEDSLEAVKDEVT